MIMTVLGTIAANIFGSEKVVSKGMELIDDAFESDSEARESKTNAKTSLLKAYAPFKLAQRYIALISVINFWFAVWVGIGIWALQEFTDVLTVRGDKQPLDSYLDVVVAFNIGWIMMTIITFYFGGGLSESLGRMVRKAKGS